MARKQKRVLICPLCGETVGAGRMQAHKAERHEEYRDGCSDSQKSNKPTGMNKGARILVGKKAAKGSVLTGLAGKTSSRNWKHTK